MISRDQAFIHKFKVDIEINDSKAPTSDTTQTRFADFAFFQQEYL